MQCRMKNEYRCMEDQVTQWYMGMHEMCGRTKQQSGSWRTSEDR